MQVTHDKKLLIAIGRSRKAAQWQNREMLWSEFLDKLANTTRTRETVNDYAAMTKAERDNVKDVGGFVGGNLKNGRRSSASIRSSETTTGQKLWECVMRLIFSLFHILCMAGSRRPNKIWWT